MEHNNNIRCFKSYNTVLTASERSSEKRQKAIYTELQKNITQLKNVNPVKNNGYTYNKNTKINTTCDISSGLVEFASSYGMLNDVKEGYPQPQVSTPKYESWCGNLYSVNYAKYNVNNTVNTSGTDVSVNIVVDPSYILFYSSCSPAFDNVGRPEQWTHIVDLGFQNTYFARAANHSNK
jgi:hypothetical protein